MAITVGHREQVRDQAPREESYIHFLARESQWVLRAIIVICIAAVLLLMFTVFYLAFIPALVLLAAYCALLIADYIEYKTHQPGDPGWEDELPVHEAAALRQKRMEAAQPAEGEVPQEVSDAVKARLTKTIVVIVASVAIAAVMVAGFFLGRDIVAIGALILFAYWLFIAAPLWLGWLEDEAEDEAHRAEEQLQERQSA